MYLSIRPGGLTARAVSVEKAAARQRKAQCYRVIHPKKRGIRLLTSATSPNGEEPDFWEVCGMNVLYYTNGGS